MPKVGKKHFPYTPQGEKQAKSFARSSGRQVQYTKPIAKSPSRKRG